MNSKPLNEFNNREHGIATLPERMDGVLL